MTDSTDPQSEEKEEAPDRKPYSYSDYLRNVIIPPGALVQVLPDGYGYLPVVLDLGPGAKNPGGTYLCLQCWHDPYDPVDSGICTCCAVNRARHVAHTAPPSLLTWRPK